MFSQWRHAVENLTQHSPKPSQDGTEDDSAHRGSTDSTTTTPSSSSSQLAESALSNLRKSLAQQRPASPSIKQSTSTDSTTSTQVASPASRSRTTLEDRLRAKFAAGETSAGSTPSPSIKGSPSSTPVIDHPLSPTPPQTEPTTTAPTDPLSPKSTPLPDSPTIEPSLISPIPLSAIVAQPLSPAVEDESAATNAIIEESKEELEVTPETETEEVHGEKHNSENEQQQATARQDDTAKEVIPENLATAPFHAEELHLDTNAPHSVSNETPQEVEVNDTDTGPVAAEVVEIAENADPSDSPILASTDVVASQDNSTTMTGSPDPPEADAAIEAAVVSEKPMQANSSEDHLITPSAEVDIEALQKRLKLVEQRFTDVSTSFKRLQAEKVAADRVLQELTSVQTIQEVDALRDYFQNMSLKTEMAQDEISRLTGKLTRQEERIEELRDIHHLESKSQSDLIDKLRAQVKEAEALLKAGQSSSQQAEEESTKRQAELEKLRAEVDKMKASAKDEEEKRAKAVSLLKTVRQKLVKAEKDKDDAVKELQTTKSREKEEREKDKVERRKLHDEIEKVNAERETAIQGLKAQFDKEVAGLKDRQEKELVALRGQYELEVITMKSLYTKETENKSSRISSLEASLQITEREKDEIFDQLQMRQAELESSQSHLESLQSQVVELQHQLREDTDRIALLNEELVEAHKAQATRVPTSTPSAEVTKLLSAAETKYEARIADLRRQLSAVERERDETEADLSKKITEKVREVEQLKSIVGKSTKAREEEEETVAALKKEIESLRDAGTTYERLIADLQRQAERVTEVESTAQAHLVEVKDALAVVEKQLEESKSKEAQARTTIKTLREELRKMQSSAALLERQRNPGAGYWASKSESTTDLRSPTSSTPDLPRDTPPGSPTTKSDEDVNYEYLRNVILQFLEHKEMRPHLVRVLSTILRFTPQETRRLVAKV